MINWSRIWNLGFGTYICLAFSQKGLCSSQGCHRRFLSGVLPQWLPHCRNTITATTVFHFAKFRQDLGLVSLASLFGPGSFYGCNYFVVKCGGNCRPENQTWVATISNVTLPLVTNLELQIHDNFTSRS